MPDDLSLAMTDVMYDIMREDADALKSITFNGDRYILFDFDDRYDTDTSYMWIMDWVYRHGNFACALPQEPYWLGAVLRSPGNPDHMVRMEVLDDEVFVMLKLQYG